MVQATIRFSKITHFHIHVCKSYSEGNWVQVGKYFFNELYMPDF